MSNTIIKRIGKRISNIGFKKVTKVEIKSINYGGILKNNRIVVTGGSKGIGYAMAKRFVDEGAEVVIVGRDEESLKKASSSIHCKYIIYDVSNIDKVELFTERLNTVFSATPNCLVCNAGISLHEASFLSVTNEGFDAQFDTNLKGAYFIAQRFLQMNFQKGLNQDINLLFISSEVGDMAQDIPYGLTKAAINCLVGGISRRFYRKGVRCNAIAPGLTVSNMTKITDNLTQDSQAAGRMFLPEEVAEVATFLLSDCSKCISGEVIHCNAGNHLRTNIKNEM